MTGGHLATCTRSVVIVNILCAPSAAKSGNRFEHRVRKHPMQRRFARPVRIQQRNENEIQCSSEPERTRREANETTDLVHAQVGLHELVARDGCGG